MPFAAAARLVGESRHRVATICERYVELALAQADFSAVHELAIDETSRARGHDYITLAADAVERRVLAVAEGRSAETVETLAGELKERGCAPEQVSSVSIDMSPAFIKGCTAQFPNARITFDKFHEKNYPMFSRPMNHDAFLKELGGQKRGAAAGVEGDGR